VEKADHGYYFDGPGEQTAVFFVPGAKVDAAAYAPLLSRIAAGGADCYLYEPPFHMAFSVTTGAEEALADYPHETWYTAGHSLGGVTASSYAIKNPAAFDGIILLAAYPADQVPDSLSVCSIYGDRDTKLDAKAYASHKANFPADTEEVVIEGANHAQFGGYGPQKGDSPAAITAEEQQDQTADIILGFLRR
jgi:pimeloyl-ACP methyl ester carboxylesterase